MSARIVRPAHFPFPFTSGVTRSAGATRQHANALRAEAAAAASAARAGRSVPFESSGTPFGMDRRASGPPAISTCGLHEWPDYGLVLHLLRPGDTFALTYEPNVGSLHSCWPSARVGCQPLWPLSPTPDTVRLAAAATALALNTTSTGLATAHQRQLRGDLRGQPQCSFVHRPRRLHEPGLLAAGLKRPLSGG